MNSTIAQSLQANASRLGQTIHGVRRGTHDKEAVKRLVEQLEKDLGLLKKELN